MCRLSRNLGALTFWNAMGLFRPVMGQLYLYLYALLVSPNIAKNFKHCLLFSMKSCYRNSFYHRDLSSRNPHYWITYTKRPRNRQCLANPDTKTPGHAIFVEKKFLFGVYKPLEITSGACDRASLT